MGQTTPNNPGCLTNGDGCYGTRMTPNEPITHHDGLYCCGTIVKEDDIIDGIGTDEYKKLCLTTEGLSYWQQILGAVDFQTWYSSYGSNTSLYGCEEITQLEAEQSNTTVPLYTTDCPYTTTSKATAQKEINQYQDIIDELTKENAFINSQISELEAQTTTITNEAPCESYVDLLENFNISFALEVLDGNTYTPVYEETIFNIGPGNLWDYIVSSSGNTGILIGDQNITLGEEGNEDTKCNDFLLDGLIKEVGGLIPTEDKRRKDLKDLLYGWWDSCWLRFEANICNQDIIDKIVNRKINMVFNINNSCSDFQIMLDRVKLTKNCEKIVNEETFISEPPKFEITKVIDNKKSWVSLDTKDERFYDLKYRPAEYDVNHHKLVINTKEIDLNLSPARAVEQDVWCYMQDNNILTCSGSTGTTTGITSDEYYSHPTECSYSATCDVVKNVTNFPLPHDTMTDYSGIWTKDIFETFGACDTTYGCDLNENSLFTTNRNTYLLELNNYDAIKQAGWSDTQNPNYPVTSISGLQQDTSVLGGYSINDIKNIPIVSWYHASAYTEYYAVSPSGNSLNTVFSGNDITYQPAVDSLATLTGITGNPGDIRGVEPYSSATYYFWNPLTNNWEDLDDGTNDIANLIEDLQLNRRANRDARLKAYNELLLSIKPFLFSNKYIIDSQVKKYIL